jgi:RecA-family ATPase
MSDAPNMIAEAHRLIDMGFRVFPVNGKVPLTKNGFKDATDNKELATFFWARNPEAGIAIATGDGLCVLDVDPRHDGDASLRELEEAHGEIDTLTVQTGGGGVHLYLRGHLPQRTGFRPGLDLKSEGGYVVAPPSLHESGQRYRWVNEDATATKVPSWLAAIVADRFSNSDLPELVPDQITTGSRNSVLHSLAGSMRRRGMSQESILAALRLENRVRCSPPLPDHEVDAIVASAARYAPDPRASPELEQEGAEIWERLKQARAEELDAGAFDLDSARIGHMLDTLPPERSWILPGILPLGVAGMLGGSGGVGKSYATLLLSCCIALEIDFWGLGTCAPGSVMILSAEDDRDEMHRRLHTVLRWLMTMYPRLDVSPLRDRLFISDRVGENNLLTRVEERTVVRTMLAEKVVTTASKLSDLQMIVLDPLSRFRGGGANGEEEATRFVEAVEVIRRGTGATVLVPAHTSKDAARGTTTGQDVIRGSSALVDGMRWVGTLMAMSQDEARKRGMAPEDARSWVRFDIPKGNYSSPFRGCWLQRQEGGILEPMDPEPIQQKERSSPADVYRSTVIRVIDIMGGRGLTYAELKRYAGQAGPLQIGLHALPGILERAIQDGHLVRVGEGRNSKIYKAGEAS